MDDKKDISNVGKGDKSSKEAGIDFETEFRESFNKALLYEKLSTTALEYIISTNPAKVILKELDGLDEQLKKECADRIKGQMQVWLAMFEKTLTAGETLPRDLIGLASDLADKDRRNK